MDESDDDDEESSDEEAEWDTEKFNPDSLVEDEEDRKYLDSLTEFEREAVLGERFEKRKAAYDMKKALRESKYVTCNYFFVRSELSTPHEALSFL